MTKQKAIRYMQHPSFTLEEWSQRDPVLTIGEIGFLLNASRKVVNYKAGPGKWSDLPYLGIETYTGDLDGGFAGSTLNDVLHDTRNPFISPSVSGVINNAGGSYLNEWILEIGQSINNVNVQFTVYDQSNMGPSNPINIDAGSNFTNEGDHPNGIITLTPSAPIVPTLPIIITLKVKVKDTKNNYSDIAESKINVFPKIIWGVSTLEDITASEFINIGQKRTLLANDYKGEYDFNAPGYGWIGIPAMLSPSLLKYEDATPGGLSFYDMVSKGTLSVNNGVTTYDYIMLRSEYYLLSSSILRIR